MRRVSLVLTLATGLLAAPTLAEPLALPSPPGARQIAVVVDRGVHHTNQLPHSLRPLRKRMVSGAAMSTADLRQLAERKDSLAALRLVKRMRAGEMKQTPSDMAFYAAVAAGAGRKGMLDDMIDALYRLDPETEPKDRVSHYIRVLYGHAWAGNALAQDALIALNGEGRLFGPMSDATRDRIVAEGGPRMTLSLAINDLARDDLDAAGLARVRGYLDHVARQDDLALRTMARALMSQTGARPSARAVQ